MLPLATVGVAFLAASTALAANTVSCGLGNLCPTDLPCCSQYGQCGVGAYCLGGCDPRSSNSLQSCVPAPVCKSQDYKLTSLNDITANTEYLGDASKTNWVSSGQPLAYQNSVLMTMAQGTVGTLLASASYVWYGKVSATMQSSRGAGVVTAFILLSDVKDEIDFEFVGADLTAAQSNFYFQGITNYGNEENLTVSDTFQNSHTYEVDWQPDELTWSIDGQAARTLKRSDTWNATDNRFHYPQSPARIQLSLWPAGLSSNGQGTVDWAGGLIDWNSADVKNNGYYYATITDVNVQCYDPPSGANVTGSKSYVYTSNAGTNNTVSLTNDNTILKSLLGTGTNMSADYSPSSSSASSASSATSGTASATSAAATSELATVPGLSGAGPGTDGQRGTDSSGSGSGSSSGGSGSSVSSASGSASTSFVQGPSTVKTGGGASQGTERVLQGSLFAVLVAVVGMLVM
ncbi:cell wall glucanase [Lasallia pustulata]|uniref:Crh-like protein n=1 Tax=Lasallia pustulata TaxID=136370 RepID=A0A1W5CX13_9LECA|nr:cell wall glucanase [Lasallia pustulata]